MATTKVCSVRIPNRSGYADIIPVHASSRNEAAALAIEQLLSQNKWTWSDDAKIEVVVHQPQSTYLVSPRQILIWANKREPGESIGTMALRHRLLNFLRPSGVDTP